MDPFNKRILSTLMAGAALAAGNASAATDTWIGTSGSGGPGNWDFTSPYWNDGTTAGVAFANGNDVIFSNSAGGAISVVGTVSPASVLFSAPGANYDLAGTGSIAGTTGITKNGVGQLTLKNVNSFTGKLTVNSGIIQVTGSVGLTNAGVNGPLGAPVGANAIIDLFNGTLFQMGNTIPRIDQATDRPLNLAGVGVGTVAIRVNDNDTGFTFGNVTATGTGAKTLGLAMGYLGNGDRETLTFTGAISNSSDGAPTGLNVSYNTSNTSYLNLSAANTFTGPISAVNLNVVGVSYLTVGGLLTGINNSGPNFQNIPGTGSLAAGNFPGSISLGSKVIFNYLSTTNQTLAGVVSGAGAVTIGGPSTVTLSGLNTYTGDTTVVTGSTLVLPAAGGMTFAINNTTSNKITGAGTASLSGVFTIDTSAFTTPTGSWTLVDAAVKSFTTTFSVAGFTQSADVWTRVIGAKTFTFTEATGVLSCSSTGLFASFGIPGFPAVIDEATLTIRLVVPKGTNLATLAPTYTVTSGSCNQTSGLPPSPTFAASNPVTYTITADSTVRNYAVTAVLGTGIINLNVTAGTNVPEVNLEGPAGPPTPGTQRWNQLNGGTLTGTGLVDSVGAPTTAAISNVMLNGADDWGINAPLKILNRTARVFSTNPGNSGSFTVSGLTANTYYDLWIASSHINGSGVGTWSTLNTNSTGSSVGIDNTGQSTNGSTWVLGVNYVRFQNVKVDSGGAITMTVVNNVVAGNRVGFNGFQLIPVDAPSGNDYDTWLNAYPSITAASDKLSTADPDGDGLKNQQEYAFGLNPASGSSVNPITTPLDKATGTFSYTRRTTSGLTYTVTTSTDLVTWITDAGSAQSVAPSSGGVEIVTFTLTNPAAGGKLFVRVKAQ